MSKLTEVACRSAKAADRPFKLTDGHNLYLLVQPDGTKLWRWNYRFAGKQKTMALGIYPDVSLAAVRREHARAREQLAGGSDPMLTRKSDKLKAVLSVNTRFEPVAREWFARKKTKWAESHSKKIIERLERDIFPWLGAREISGIEAPELLAVLQRIEARGAIDTAHRAKQNCGQIFRYAIVTGRAKRNPSADLQGALESPQEKHYPTATDPKKVTALLLAIRTYRGSFVTRCALRLAPLVFQRPGELRHARWEEFDLDEQLWEIPADRMKGSKAKKAEGGSHYVPLSRQAVAVLRELFALTGPEGYVFQGARDRRRPMSENTVNGALHRLGYKGEMVGHGFGAMARTILDERLKVRPDFIERQLAHKVIDPLGVPITALPFGASECR